MFSPSGHKAQRVGIAKDQPIASGCAQASSGNSATQGVEAAAKKVKAARRKVAARNPFLAFEACRVQMNETLIDFARESREMANGLKCHAIRAARWRALSVARLRRDAC